MFQHNKKRENTLYLIVDHTGTTSTINLDVTSINNSDRAKSFFGIRYHYVITRDGELQEGRTLDRVSPLTGVLDKDAVTLCLVGGKDLEGNPEDNFTVEQKQALRELITVLRSSHPDIEVLGRREVKRQRTSGPALDLDPFR